MKPHPSTWPLLLVATSIGAQSIPQEASPPPPPTTTVAPSPVAPTPGPAAPGAPLSASQTKAAVGTTNPNPGSKADSAGTKAPAAATSAPSAAPAAGGEGGFQVHPGLSFGTLTVDGQTWTRLSFMPEVEFGKLGIGFNLEVFLDQNQNLASKGWEFENREQTLESILRKVDYVRWAKPGDPFYARVGTLQGIDLGHGLVASGYSNMARYPDYKLLGLNAQLNDIGSLGWDAEVVVNDLQNLNKGGPFTAGKLGIHPLKPMGIPVFGGLSVSVGAAYDWNQYAGLRDRDADGCPDPVDARPDDGSTCVQDPIQRGLPFVDAPTYASADSMARAQSEALRGNYQAEKPFSVIWAQADLPVVRTDLFGLDLYSVFAKPQTQDPAAADAGWGLIPVGAGSHLGPVTLSAEYRLFRDPFQPGYFDAQYDAQRVTFAGVTSQTKELLVYGKGTAKEGWLQGYYAGARWDALGYLVLAGNYSHMFPSRSTEDELRAAGGSVALGKDAVAILKKISSAEVYWRKDRIGLDRRPILRAVPQRTNPSSLGVRSRMGGPIDGQAQLAVDAGQSSQGVEGVDYVVDGFFDNSRFTVFGVRLGSQIAPGLELIVDRQTTFVLDERFELKRMNQMRLETRFVF